LPLPLSLPTPPSLLTIGVIETSTERRHRRSLRPTEHPAVITRR
jgi:hypothetical protein